MSYAGEAWERPEGMSDAEYYKGKTLENAHIAQGRADTKLNQQLGRIEAQRSSALQSAAINNDKLMKYLPTQLKAMGMSNLGVSQSSYVRAANDYASQRGAINQQFNDAASSAWDAYADGQAQRDIQLNQSMTELEKYYGEKEEQKAKEAEASAKADQKTADDTFLARIQSVEWNSPEELEAFISDAEAKGSVSEDAIAWARYLQTDYTGDFAKAEEQRTTAESDQTKAQVTASVKSMVNNALAAGRTKESIMADISAYQGQIDPVVWAEITSAINSGEHLRLTAEEEKAAAEEKATADQTKARYESALGNVVKDGISTNMSPDEIRNLMAKYHGQVDDITWAGFMDDIAIYETAWNDYQQKEQTAEQQAITAEADAKAQFIIDNIARMTQTQARSEIDAIKDQLSPAMAWMVEMAMNMHATEVEMNKIEADEAAEKQAAAEVTANSDAQISDIFSFENYEDYNGTPEDLWEDLSEYLDTASPTVEQAAKRKYEDFERWYEEQAAFTEQDELAVQQMETDAKVLEGRTPVEYNTQKWRITGEAMKPADVYDDDFMEALKAIQIVTPTPGTAAPGAASYSRVAITDPYDEKLRNGMTVKVGEKAYTFYNGDWYPSEKSK